MALKFDYTLQPPASACNYVSRAKVAEIANRLGCKWAGNKQPIGVTECKLTWDVSGLRFGTLGSNGNFETGVAALKLQQQIYLADDLSTKESEIWYGHELLHFWDNTKVFYTMGNKLLEDKDIRYYYTDRNYFAPKEAYLVKNMLPGKIESLFRWRQKWWVGYRDTEAEYSRCETLIAGG